MKSLQCRKVHGVGRRFIQMKILVFSFLRFADNHKDTVLYEMKLMEAIQNCHNGFDSQYLSI